jgi:hypothetical protein
MTQPDFIVGYGSLLSAYSRSTYSGLTDPALPVVAHGWKRGWTVRYRDEAATYAGVRPAPGHSLHAALVPAQITDALRHRERGYVFTQLDRDTVRPAANAASDLPEGRFWIVVNREQVRADTDHPIPQTYIDTCLAGCLETGGEARARAFVRNTELWDSLWIDDRNADKPLYPRHTPLTAGQCREIDRILEAEGVLRYRQPAE